MSNGLNATLSALQGSQVNVPPKDIPGEAGQAPVLLTFSSGPILAATYWRVIKNATPGISSFDHGQQYGLPTVIDALAVLRETLTGKDLVSAMLEPSTGDLLLSFAGELALQVFNFTGYEIWSLHFPNGAVEYSNFNK